MNRYFFGLNSYYFTRILLAVLLSAGTGVGETLARARYLMGTACEIEAHGNSKEELGKAVSEAFDEIARLEGILSHFIPESELSRMNRTEVGVPFRCSPELFEVLTWSERARRETDGAFDISRGMAVWTLDVKNRTFTFIRKDRQTLLDFGGIGKGYALDEAGKKLERSGVDGARLNFGGQVLLVGKPLSPKGWSIRLALPGGGWEDLWLKGGSLSTSSNDERSHIIDPRTGKPSEFRGSASVIASTGVWADALSTALLVMGEQAGRQWVKRYPDIQVIYHSHIVAEEGKKK